MEVGHLTNTQSQTPLSHTHLQASRNSNSPIQRQMQHPSNTLQNSNLVSTSQQLHQTPSYRTLSPASSINSDRGNRYINPSFQNKQATPPHLASMQSARLSPMESLQSSTFQPQYRMVPSEGDGQVNLTIPNLKPIPNRNNASDCRLTINPVAKYTIRDCEDSQTWAPLLKAAQQESTLW